MKSRVIKAICAWKGMTQAELATRLNTSPQNLSNRLKRGSLKRADLEKIAKILGAEYVLEEHFVFPDGTKI